MVFCHQKEGRVRASVTFVTKKCFFLLKASLFVQMDSEFERLDELDIKVRLNLINFKYKSDSE